MNFGKTCLGWATSKNAKQPAYTFGARVTAPDVKTLTLYPVWDREYKEGGGFWASIWQDVKDFFSGGKKAHAADMPPTEAQAKPTTPATEAPTVPPTKPPTEPPTTVPETESDEPPDEFYAEELIDVGFSEDADFYALGALLGHSREQIKAARKDESDMTAQYRYRFSDAEMYFCDGMLTITLCSDPKVPLPRGVRIGMPADTAIKKFFGYRNDVAAMIANPGTIQDESTLYYSNGKAGNAQTAFIRKKANFDENSMAAKQNYDFCVEYESLTEGAINAIYSGDFWANNVPYVLQFLIKDKKIAAIVITYYSAKLY